MKPFRHFNARTIQDAIRKLTEHKPSVVIAGGTDCLGILKGQLLPTYPEALINIKTIPEHNAIKEVDGELRIGALAKLSDIAESPIVREKYRILAEAANQVASPQIRGMATLGGNLCQEVRCWYYRHPHQIGGRILCLRKGGKICNALVGDHRYHSIFGGAPIDDSCLLGCPIRTDLPSLLNKVRDGKLSEAGHILLSSNPIPAITGRVCPNFCEKECHRWEYDEAVALRSIERSLGDYLLERRNEFYKPPEVRSGKRIAIVGSGPAGLAAAYFLRKSGHEVTVYEKRKEAGGMLLYGIPTYRLSKDVVRRQVQTLEGMGITFKVGVQVGKGVTITRLANRFDAVFLACGAWKERTLGIKGEEIALSGLEFLNRVNTGDREIPGDKVGIIGGGNVAIDAARTLLRLGAHPVVIYRRSQKEMPAFQEEIEKAREEGIEFKFLTLPIEASRENGRVKLKFMRMELGTPDKSGRPQPIPIPDSDFVESFDAVIQAIGEESDLSPLPVEFRKKRIKKGATAFRVGKNLWVGGDFINGPSTVAQAVASGREAANLIDRSLIRKKNSFEKDREPQDFRIPSFEAVHRIQVPKLPLWERIKSVDMEETGTLSLNEIKMEARRCLNCGCLAVNPSDMGTVLIALGAKIVTTKRILDIQDFFASHGSKTTVLDPDEIVVEIQIPRPPKGTHQTFIKFRLRKAIDFSIVNVASVITIEDRICKDARIVLGAVGPKPIRATKAEEMIKGKVIDLQTAKIAAEVAVEGASPLAMNGYKVQIIRTLVKRALLNSTIPS